MSKKANPTVIGAFVAGGITLAIILLVALGGGKFFDQTMTYVMFFPGSVKGLKVGSPVVFRGVLIGSVSDIRLEMDPKKLTARIPVYVQIDENRVTTPDGTWARRADYRDVQTMIELGLRAQLVSQSLVTGQLMIQFDFHPDAPLNLIGTDPEVMELPTIPTPLQEMAKTLASLNLAELGEKLGATLESITEALGSPEVGEGLGALSRILEETEGLIRDVRTGIAPVLTGADVTLQNSQQLLQNLDGTVTVVSSDVRGALGDARTLMRRIDGRVDPLADDAHEMLERGGDLLGRADQVTAELLVAVERVLNSADDALAQATSTLQNVDAALEGNSVISYELTKALQEIGGAARSIRVLSDLLQQRPDALLRGKPTRGQ